MTRASHSGGERSDLLHIYRPFASGRQLRALQKIVADSLPKGVNLSPRGARDAGVSLLDNSTFGHVLEHSRRSHRLQPHLLGPALRRAVPSSGEAPITVPVSKELPVRMIGDRCLCLAVMLDSPDLEEERRSVHGRLATLGHVGIPEKWPCHVTLGTLSETVPGSTIDNIAENLGSQFNLGAVLPAAQPDFSAKRVA